MDEKWRARQSVDGDNEQLDTWELARYDSAAAYGVPGLVVFAQGMVEEDAQRLAALLNAVWAWEI